MMQKEKRRARSKKEWKELVKEYSTSGLKKSEYCRKKGISRGTFYIWNEVLREEEEGKFIPITIGGREEGEKEKCRKEIKSRVSIEVKNGLRVEFKDGCKVSEIEVIVSILGC